ncbi:MAG: hypothetical protein ACLPYS_06690 [Vulcanimicrobiaceae bacterium]|jgi:hypothetical protein
MAKGEVWNEVRTLFRVGPVKVVEARLFVAQDDTKPLPSAFQMLVSLRVLGSQIDNDAKTNNFAVKDGDCCVPIAVASFTGNIDGKVVNWHGTDWNGSPSADAAWADTEKVHFSLLSMAQVTIPVADILQFIPGIGGVLRALLQALPGQRVSFTLGHVGVDIPVHRVDGKVALPRGAVVPQWWP